MGIHASDNLSHLAHQSAEPSVPNHYDYDEYVIVDGNNGERIAVFSLGQDMWDKARKRFLKLFVAEKRAVKLIGRVFN